MTTQTGTPDDTTDLQTTETDTNIDTAEADESGDVSTDEAADEPDWKAEADKWKAMARKHEGRAKENAQAAKELEEFRRSQLDDTGRAVAEAADKARSEARAEYAARLVDAEVRSAAAGSNVDVDALLDGLDRSRFVADGEVDADSIREWVGRVAPAKPVAAKVDLGQGARSETAGGGKITRDQLQTMTPAEIVKARQEGRIDFSK